MSETRFLKNGCTNYTNRYDMRLLLLKIWHVRCDIIKDIEHHTNRLAREIVSIEDLSNKIAIDNGIEIPDNSDFMIVDENSECIMRCANLEPLVVEYKKLYPTIPNWGFRSYIADRCKKEIGYSLNINNGDNGFLEIFNKMYYIPIKPDDGIRYIEREYREDSECKTLYEQALRNWES